MPNLPLTGEIGTQISDNILAMFLIVAKFLDGKLGYSIGR